jgi:uncharacterized phage-associated protein
MEVNMEIQFNINTQKVIEAVLWIIQKEESNMYNIFKILFSADKYHLNTYGRPVTGDTYIAMDYGPVPSWLYDEAKSGGSSLGFSNKNNIFTANRRPNMYYLSESDEEALNYGYEEYAGKSFDEVLDKSHTYECWQRQYARGKNMPIPLDTMIDDDKDWLKKDLALFGSCMVI